MNRPAADAVSLGRPPHAGDNCGDVVGTTPWMGEVERRAEPTPRAKQDARAEVGRGGLWSRCAARIEDLGTRAAARTRVTFFARAKKVTKESTPRDLPSAALRVPCAPRPLRDARQLAPCGRSDSLASLSAGDCGARPRQGVWKTVFPDCRSPGSPDAGRRPESGDFLDLEGVEAGWPSAVAGSSLGCTCRLTSISAATTMDPS